MSDPVDPKDPLTPQNDEIKEELQPGPAPEPPRPKPEVSEEQRQIEKQEAQEIIDSLKREYFWGA